MLPFPLEIVEEILHDVNWVEEQEEGTACKRMWNSGLHLATGQLRKQLDVGFVIISDNHQDLETKALKLYCNFEEMFDQSCSIQGDHWRKTYQVAVIPGH